MSIEQEIAAWDGKSADEIREIYASYSAQPDFADTVIRLIHRVPAQRGATWLLKAWLESGNSLEKGQVREVYSLLPALEHWETKLHVLQCIPFMPIEAGVSENVDAFLRAAVTDSNKFVRAWSYNGFYELATQFPEYRAEVEERLASAMEDEAASVKARIRNIMKRGFESSA